jgi:hypothetical protein
MKGVDEPKNVKAHHAQSSPSRIRRSGRGLENGKSSLQQMREEEEKALAY